MWVLRSGRVRRFTIGQVALASLILAIPAHASAAWQEPAPGPLNFATVALSPSIASVGGLPYVAWSDYDPGYSPATVRVARLASGSWHTDSLNVSSQAAHTPSIARVFGVAYVAWEEGQLIYVKQRSGGMWHLVGGAVNSTSRRGVDPSITGVNGVPYVAWSERNAAGIDQVRVKKFTGGSWRPVGGSLNIDSAKPAFNPRIIGLNTVPYVVWAERSSNFVTRIRVKKFTGGGWHAVGGSPNRSAAGSGNLPGITFAGGIPYVVWAQFADSVWRIRVKKFTNGSWQNVGGWLNLDPGMSAYSPSISTIAGIPYVAWSDNTTSGNAQIRVKTFTAGAWHTVGGALSEGGASPSITGVGPTPFVAWQQNSGSWCVPKCVSFWDIRVKEFHP